VASSPPPAHYVLSALAKKMKTTLSYLLIIAACLTLTGCPTPMCLNPNPSYSFEVTAEFTPEKDSIRVGDTLYLVSEFPSTMIPAGSTQPVDYSRSTGISNILNVNKLEPNRVIADAVFDFDYINIDGEIYNSRDIPSPNRVQQLRYEEKSGMYRLKVGLIPKAKGIYSLATGFSGLSNGRKSGDKCTKASFPTTVTNEDPHLHYLSTHTDTPPEELPPIHYLFKVY
jgi:hypothetical protein